MSQESLSSNNFWENEELTEAELDALAGGDLLALKLDPNILSQTVTQPSNDSLFTSFVGAHNTTNPLPSPPLNTSLLFP